MKFITSKKFLLNFLGVSSMVLASSMRDIKSHQIAKSVSEYYVEDSVVNERSVASEQAPSKVAQIFLPVEIEANRLKINGLWEITRIIGDDAKPLFDKFQSPEDAKKSVKMKLELIGNGIVRANGDNSQVYRISILTDFNTIAIFKRTNKGFEIVEAKKIIQKIDNQLELETGEVDLILERALNQSKGNKVLTGADVSGQLTLSGNNISHFSVTLHNSNGEDQSLEIDSTDILDGGAFKAEVGGEEVSGIMFNNGKEGYRVSFVTGPLSGAMLSFVTKEQFDQIQEKEMEQQRDNPEQVDQSEQAEQAEIRNVQSTNEVKEVQPLDEVKDAQASVVEERQIESENLPEDQKLTVEEIKQNASENGFAF